MKYSLMPLIYLLIAASTSASECGTCHADIGATLSETPHAILQKGSEPDMACTQCHGAAAAHLANPFAGGVLAFANESVKMRNEACASCHSDAHNAGNSAHEAAGVACNDCHSVHGNISHRSERPAGFENLVPSSAICIDCHADVLAQFAFNKRHRLAENSVTCTDCHNPHDEPRAGQIPHDTATETCSNCHAEQQGPFVFEHDASRVDGCLACHSPHGSANRHLLSHQAVGELCFSCHAAMPQFHLGFAPGGAPRFGTETVCTNCHVTIHGSNLDKAFLK